MKHPFVIFLCFVFSSHLLLADRNSNIVNADSLYNLLKTTRTDTIKVKLYNQLAGFYYGRNADSMKFYSLKSLELIKKKLPEVTGKEKRWYLNLEAEAYNSLAVANSNLGNDADVVECYNLSLRIREELGDKDAMANSLNNLGVYYDEKGDASKALGYY